MNNLNPDLISLIITLRPINLQNRDERGYPDWWGRAAHALLLQILEEADPHLSAWLHDELEGPKPFTASSLIGFSSSKGLNLERTYLLRLTAFHAQVVSCLQHATQPDGLLRVGARIELDYTPFQIEAVTWVEHPWAACTTYQALSAPYLLAQKTPRKQIDFQISTPIAFKSCGKHTPIPMPSFVFGSLLKRWNAFAPVAFPPEVKRYAEECLVISRYQLKSRSVTIKSKGSRVGGVGSITYRTLNYDRYWMNILQTLSSFALFSGAGISTTMGLGQIRSLQHAHAKHSD